MMADSLSNLYFSLKELCVQGMRFIILTLSHSSFEGSFQIICGGGIFHTNY